MSDGNITVGSAHVDLGPAFREMAEEKIRQAARKHLGDLEMASVHVAREGVDFRCSVSMRMRGHNLVAGEALADDARLAFRTALEKVAKQLRRAKRLLREDRLHRPEKINTA